MGSVNNTISPNGGEGDSPEEIAQRLRGQSLGSQLKALVRKSQLMQKRQYRTNICQLLFPLMMIVMLFVLQLIVNDLIQSILGLSSKEDFHPKRQTNIVYVYDDDAENCTHGSMSMSDTKGRFVVAQNGQDEIGDFAADSSGAGFLGKAQLPSQGMMRAFYALGASPRGPPGTPPHICFRRPVMITALTAFPEASMDEVNKRLYDGWADDDDQFLGGISFDELDVSQKKIHYNPIVNTSLSSKSDMPAILALFSNAAFRYLVSEHGGLSPQGLSELVMAGTKGYPTPAKEITFDIISLAGPQVYIYVFSLLLPVFLGNLVSEKEHQLREIMKMMGLKTHVYFMVTYAFNLAMYMVATGFVVGAASILGFRYFIDNSFWVYFLLLFIYGNVLCALASLMSVFFSKAKSATVMAYLFIFGSGIISVSLIRNFYDADTDEFTLFIIQLMPPFAFYRGLLELSNGVAFGATGLKFSDLSEPDIHLDEVYWFLFVEWIVCMILAVYLEQVFPSEMGIKKHPLFCLPAYRSAGYSRDLENPDKLEEGPDVERIREIAENNEEATGGEQIVIRLKHLRKEFPNVDGKGPNFVAVKNLSMVMKTGECFGFLGSNGAGKSTTISMLCGYIMPTQGSATIYGKDIVEDATAIHTILGVCPQENVLWLDLTGGEHLEFFGRLKGLIGKSLEDAVVQGLREVELLEVRHKKSGQYSGGMKRRLCVAISLIGNPKVVLLDEPTTGLDPAARHNLWNVILQKKKSCAIMLTTHSMEEAEYLCDTLGIFEHGTLKCVGTSTQLKHRFEKCYKMTVTASPERVDEISKFCTALVPGTKVQNTLGGTFSFEVPSKDARLSHVFQQMQMNHARLSIHDWGISNTTLEEVFVAIATGAYNIHDEAIKKAIRHEQESHRLAAGVSATTKKHTAISMS